MLSLQSREPATLLDLVELCCYLLFILALLLLDVVISPQLAVHLYGVSARSVVRSFGRVCWALMKSAWGSPWPILALHVLLVYRLLRWASTIIAWASDNLLECSCSTPAGLCLSGLASILYSGAQFRKWTTLLRRHWLADFSGGANVTQADLTLFGFRWADRVHAARWPLDSYTAWAVRALLLSAHCTTGVLSMLGDARLQASVWRASELSRGGRPAAAGLACTSFNGLPIACTELERVRTFNRAVMPRLGAARISRVRREMNAHNLLGHVWHVGHACPDPRKDSARDEEDHGCNLFAQFSADNSQLGPCLVSCAEAEYVSAHHVQCTRSDECIRRCETVC